MNRILIAESDKELAYQLKVVFVNAGNYPMSCNTIKKTRAMLKCEEWTVVLIDEQMSDGSGFELLKDIKKDTIVVMIFPEDADPDIRELRGQGISDFIKKPFNPIVLKAKVGTQLKKKSSSVDFGSSARFEALGAASPEFVGVNKVIYIDKYELDFDNNEYKYMENSINLGHLERSLLKILVENRGVVLKKNALIERLYTESKIRIDNDMLADTVRILREKLSAFNYIKTIYGIGYMWTAHKET